MENDLFAFICKLCLIYQFADINENEINPDQSSGVDKDYIVQISGKYLILSIVPETYSLVCTI